MEPLDEVRFWRIVIDESRRTVVCSPDLESRVKGWVDARGLSGTITVHASPFCPDDQLMVIDQGAIDAALAEEIQRSRPRFLPLPFLAPVDPRRFFTDLW